MILFGLLHVPTEAIYPISDVAKFHPMCREMYQSSDVHSWVWKPVDLTDVIGVTQISVTSWSDKPHQQGFKPLSHPSCNQNLSVSLSVLRVKVTDSNEVLKYKQNVPS